MADSNEGCPANSVTGIGGLFFRARDPVLLGRWCRDHFGVDLIPSDCSVKPWSQEAGPTAFAPFPADTDCFGRPEQGWMVNFRARYLDAIERQLREAGVAVNVGPAAYPNGRFARVTDPEGNPIELWERADPVDRKERQQTL